MMTAHVDMSVLWRELPYAERMRLIARWTHVWTETPAYWMLYAEQCLAA